MEENYCAIQFKCVLISKCIYRTKPKSCKYRGKESNSCNSAVAQVNRMMLHGNHIGLELSAKGFSQK